MSVQFGYRPQMSRGVPPPSIVPRSRIPAPKVMVRRNLTMQDERKPDCPFRRSSTIAAGVAAKHGVTLAMLMGESRVKHIVAARHEAWWLVWRTTGMSYPRIGAIFRRDHTTIMHGVKKHDAKMSHAPVN